MNGYCTCSHLSCLKVELPNSFNIFSYNSYNSGTMRFSHGYLNNVLLLLFIPPLFAETRLCQFDNVEAMRHVLRLLKGFIGSKCITISFVNGLDLLVTCMD
jgi:hypothetical protein